MVSSYKIFHKHDPITLQIVKELKALLDQSYKYEESKPELIISVGGDGTMLKAVHEHVELLESTFFIGIHTGTLGFFTEYQKDELRQFVEDLKKGDYTINRRNILELDIYDENNNLVSNNEYMFALNEIRLENPYMTQVLDVYIDDEYLETFRGTGICVSTTSGSTAYNKSLGGAVLSPNLEAMQITEIAGIGHNAYRSLGSSLVLAKGQRVTLVARNGGEAVLGLDQNIYHTKDGYTFNIKLSNRYVHCIQCRPFSFINRLRRTYISE